MTAKAFRFPGQSITASHAGGLLTGGGVLTVTVGSGIVCNPGATVAATALVTGVTYKIKSLGTTDWSVAGAPANATVGTRFTAITVGTGTGTATVDPDSTLLNGPGIPEGVHITGQLTGSAGGTGTYSTDAIGPLTIPSCAMTVGRHFTATASAATSFPVAVDGTVQSIVAKTNAADTGSVANAYVQGSVDGQGWINLSSALAIGATGAAVQYNSLTSGNQVAFSHLRFQNGTVTGTVNVTAAVRSVHG
jgi:hypothetical protein